MCADCQLTFAGSNFITRLLLSPANNTEAFRAALKAAGADPLKLSEQSRQRMDQFYTRSFELAVDANRQCIDFENACILLREAVASELLGADASAAKDPASRA